jgi:AcrR family transcriptional regulator
MVNVITGRDRLILDAAVELAKIEGYQWITREAVAERAGVAPATVNNAFGTMRDLKRAVLKEAVEKSIIEIVAQGLADGHAIARAAPEELRKLAAEKLIAA